MRRRRAVLTFIIGVISLILLAGAVPGMVDEDISTLTPNTVKQDQRKTTDFVVDADKALSILDTLPVKGRASKAGYARAQFGDGWSTVKGCTTRNIILNRDLQDVVLDDECKVVAGTLHDPYSGEIIYFTKENSSAVQIDHVVALSDAWQKGAQQLSTEQRRQLANDPLELLAVSGQQNQAKSDGDAATWLPKNKAFRCEYIMRQIAVKAKYALWVTTAEKNIMRDILSAC